MFFIVLGVFCLAGAVYLVGEAATLPARQRQASVSRAATYGRFRAALGPHDQPFRDRVLTPLSGRVAGLVLKIHPQTTLDSISAKLLAAGLGRSISPTGFLAAKGFVALGGLFLGALLGGAAAGARGSLLLALVFGGLGFLVPDFAVTTKARSRRDKMRAQLPDALDLLAVSVEAGLGFDGAVAKLTEHMDGPLPDEFALTLSEMRIGESRQDALKKMAERAATPEVSSFARAIIQADQLGTSLGRILRVQATDSRLKRQAAAEEKAMKAPIKMLFPTVMFIFPAMFLVILGPAFLNLKKIF
jgi:tight adherence protein C